MKKVMTAIVGFSVIIFLIFQTNVIELFTIILTIDLRFLIVAMLFYIMINLVQAARIKVVLLSQGYKNISTLKIFWIHMAGNLMGDATPGRTGYLSIVSVR
ncbi:MAG: flippase-like domain-containing protein [Candidatus Lokiarchaeota archaeon]|nr:flippase-like domain-containing protein [Candidatus Lokiarchaeota archaeon]